MSRSPKASPMRFVPGSDAPESLVWQGFRDRSRRIGLTESGLFRKLRRMSENAFSLIVCLPGEEPARHDLAGDSVTFGRSPENQIQMLVAEVSVRHGRLDREGDGYRVVDPGSTNGTRLNGAPVGPDGVPLKPMDRLVIGTVLMLTSSPPRSSLRPRPRISWPRSRRPRPRPRPKPPRWPSPPLRPHPPLPRHREHPPPLSVPAFRPPPARRRVPPFPWAVRPRLQPVRVERR